MNKPDWNDAPEWAKYLAMDGDSVWVWYGSEPRWNPDRDKWESRGWIQRMSIEAVDTMEQRP